MMGYISGLLERDKTMTMISEELVNVLRCPLTRDKVQNAEEGLVDELNRLIAGQSLRTQTGTLIRAPLDGGLVRSDHKLLYPVRDGIPIMLTDEAIPLESLHLTIA